MSKNVLLKHPENNDIPRIFVAATRQNEGKTTTCLGLYGALQKYFANVGYIKPIGQRFVDVQGLKIDEDSLLLDSIYDVNIPIAAMSPIAIHSTFTRRYLSGEESHDQLVDTICRAFDRTAYEKDVVIIEGSGHAGVGAVCNLSNAQVAKMLGAQAILVSTGGIGRPVDEIALNKSLFDKYGVPVVGAILNKVLPDKLEFVREYAGKGLENLGIPLLGVLPVQPRLTAPNMGQVVEELEAEWLNAKDTGATNRIEKVTVGAMTAKGIIEHFKPGCLIITPGDRDDIILSAAATTGLSNGNPVSGMILTHNIRPHPKLMDMLSKTDIPVALSSMDSYATASKIHSMTVKTQPHDTDKIPIIKKLVSDHVDLPLLKQLLNTIPYADASPA